MIKETIKYFDRLEKHVRSKLSHMPIIYALLGSIGIVLIWRGIWVIADDFNMSGWLSVLIGVLLSMFIGLFVSFFVGDRIIISGIKNEKRIDEKTEDEIKLEEISISEIKNSIDKENEIDRETEKEIKEIKDELENINKKFN